METFGPLDGEKLRSAPKGFAKDHKYIDLLKLKSFLAVRMIPDKEITSDDVVKEVVGYAKMIKPLNDFLNSNE